MEVFFTPIALLIIGLVLVFLEFILPGGIMGIAGGIVLALSIFAFATVTSSPIAFAAYFIVVVSLIVIIIRYALQRIRQSAQRNTLMSSQDQEGFIASSFDKDLIGKTGIATTDLGLSGKILVEGQEVQAVSQWGYIKQGTKVNIINGEGARYIVREEKHGD